MFSEKEISEAWSRFGRSDIGRIARLKLKTVLESTRSQGTDCSALNYTEGRRNLASEILILMDADLPNDGTDDTITARPRSVRIATSSGSGGRRVPIKPPVRV